MFGFFQRTMAAGGPKPKLSRRFCNKTPRTLTVVIFEGTLTVVIFEGSNWIVFTGSKTHLTQVMLCQPTGGLARLTEGCSFRRPAGGCFLGGQTCQ